MGKYFNKKEKEEKEEYKFPEYTNQELWALNNLLKEKYNDGNKTENIIQWLIDEGGLNEWGAVIYTGIYPTRYEVLQDKIAKANKLLGRKEFAQKKELEELEKNMTVHADI